MTEKQEWQPIRTAPRDGESILLWSPYWSDTFGVSIGQFDQFAADAHGHDCWLGSEFDTATWDASEQPTHWMPLPEPPPDPDEEGDDFTDGVSEDK